MMDFSFKPKLSKDIILDNITEEQIMAYYLHVNVQDKKLFRSPLRNDKNPTCSLFRNKSNKLIFKDFATGQYLNCFEIVEKLFDCNYYDALAIIANDFNIVPNPDVVKNKGKIISKDVRIEEKEFSKIQVALQDFSDIELRWWNKFGISSDTLNKFNVYSCKYVFLNGNIIAQSKQSCPIYGYYGDKYHGEELWRIYFPFRTSYRFLGNYPKKKIQGYTQLPRNGKLLVITKSLKDCMCLYELGIPAIAPCSETQFIDETMIECLKKRFQNIVVFFDNDETGIKFMRKIKKSYPEFNYIFIPRSYGAKDISDYFAKYGKRKTQELIKNYLLWLKKML